MPEIGGLPSLTELIDAQDRLTRAIHGARALDWLLQHAPTSEQVSEKWARVEVNQTCGRSLSGAEAGHDYLNRAARTMLPDIGLAAIELAKRDIEAAKGDVT